jgi:putative hemolysin
MTASRILAATATVSAPAGPASPVSPSYSVLIASEPAEIIAAQRLRHRVFAEEMGATLTCPVPGLDIDEFDEYCDHLVVREDHSGQTVGTYRMLPPQLTPTSARARPGRLYADTEFDLSALAPLRDVLVETGRSCVDPEHRNGAVINLMWTGIARYLHLHGYRWLAGCASVPVDSAPVDSAPVAVPVGPAPAGSGRRGDLPAADAVWQLVRATHLSPPRLRVTPRNPYPYRDLAGASRAALLAAVPPLLRGYLRLGAWVCGEPAYDPDFRVADFFVLLSLDRVDPRYLNHFLGADRRP